MYKYKKSITILLLCNMVLALCWFNLKGLQFNRIASTPAFEIRFMEDCASLDAADFVGMVVQASSGQRVVDYTMLEREPEHKLSEEDYEILLRIVEAEAGCEDIKGKMLVAGVIMNRVESSLFPDTVKEVVFQRENGVAQFSPISDGRYETVRVSEETREAVKEFCMERILPEEHSILQLESMQIRRG